MAKRRGKEPASDGPAPEGEPTLEQRVAVLERDLKEKDDLLQRQARALVIAAENGQALRESRAKVARLEKLSDEAAKKAKEAKKRHESAIEDHFALEQELDSGQQRLPFGPDEPATAAAPSSPAPAEPDETWKVVPLATLGIDDELPAGLLAKLEDAGLKTVGDVADHTKPDQAGRSKQLVDIKGIGQAAAAKIETALEQFWAKHAARLAAAASSPADPATDDPVEDEDPDEDDPEGDDPEGEDLDPEEDDPDQG